MQLQPGYVAKSGRTTTRLRSSAAANPRFQVTFDDHTSYPTSPDASCAYGINNPELDGKVQVKIERGQITAIFPLDD